MIKVKVKLSLCFNSALRHEGVLGKRRYSSTHALTSALYGGELSASRAGRFDFRKRAPATHWIGGWVGPRAILDAVVKRKIPSPRDDDDDDDDNNNIRIIELPYLNSIRSFR
jgi:hypothetical protein